MRQKAQNGRHVANTSQPISLDHPGPTQSGIDARCSAVSTVDPSHVLQSTVMPQLRLRKTVCVKKAIENPSKMQKKADSNNTLKYVSLITLTLQNAILGLSMRYARTRDGDMFFSSTEAGGVAKLIDTIDKQLIKQPMDTLKVCVPSFVYLVQNNLLYVSASHLDAATYQVTYQLKILTTAMFSVFILKRTLLNTQWFSLVTLIVGVVLVQLAQGGESVSSHNAEGQNRFIGFMAALAACVLSGFAGVYFEKMLKGSDVTVWMRNVQLSMCSIPFGWLSCYLYDGAAIREKGFFFGYDKFVNYLVLLQAVGGLIVAVVVKYADNILKGFATSLAIVISCVASIYIFDFQLSAQFALGAAFVIFSIFLYGYTPKKLESSGAFKV
ncbi:UDP-N-acetylglucosamine transporter isoform X2 [Cylas formicarius]|uniref:UDP-N-acetylglucosamine transporter isoform X2 n=1 Tax=Cylas formicarius TaxID=197179 RepID=UPI002958B3FE|nr:UDP-N-acetylglucosamine transporter isoform X2 [Cylas formicarius]